MLGRQLRNPLSADQQVSRPVRRRAWICAAFHYSSSPFRLLPNRLGFRSGVKVWIGILAFRVAFSPWDRPSSSGVSLLRWRPFLPCGLTWKTVDDISLIVQIGPVSGRVLTLSAAQSSCATVGLASSVELRAANWALRPRLSTATAACKKSSEDRTCSGSVTFCPFNETAPSASVRRALLRESAKPTATPISSRSERTCCPGGRSAWTGTPPPSRSPSPQTC